MGKLIIKFAVYILEIEKYMRDTPELRKIGKPNIFSFNTIADI